MSQDLKRLAAELHDRFPDAGPISPMKLLGSGFGSYVVETPGGVVFRIARNAETGARFHFECSLLGEVAQHLPVAVPAPKWQAFDLEAAQHGVIGYKKLGGAPLNGEVLTDERACKLGVQIGEFLTALHRVKPSDLTTPLAVFDARKALSADFCTRVRAVLIPHAGQRDLQALDDWLTKAPTRFSDDPPLVLSHGDLWFENLLVSPELGLTGVLDWTGATASDPARDFAALSYNGQAYVEAACRAYADATGDNAEELVARASSFLLLRELIGLLWATEHDTHEVPDAAGKVISLLRTPEHTVCAPQPGRTQSNQPDTSLL